MRWQSLLGLVAILLLAWVLGENRRRVHLRTLAVGVFLQLAFVGLMLNLPWVKNAFAALNRLVVVLQEATAAGTSFVFGYLGGGSIPFDVKGAGMTFIFAFQALPMILVISALSALFYYWPVLPWVVRFFSWVLKKTLGVGGAVGVGAAANIFMGMVEAPLLIRPYLARLTRSELFTVMTCGMATVAGTVMALYAAILTRVLPDALGHILIASLISAPAAIVVARLMVPEAGELTEGRVFAPIEATSAMDAVTQGTTEGLKLYLNILALLVVLVALVHLANAVLGLLPQAAGGAMTLERIFGWVMAPICWLMGVPWAEAETAGRIMGVKTVLNELIAYVELAKLPEAVLSPRSRLILTYSLCGFANFGSLGIMIGGLSAVAPERRAEIAALGLRSIVSGTLATCLTGAVIGAFTP